MENIHQPTDGKTRLAVRIGLFSGGYLAILWLASFAKGLLPGQWGSLDWGLASSLAIFAMTVFFSSEGKPPLG